MCPDLLSRPLMHHHGASPQMLTQPNEIPRMFLGCLLVCSCPPKEPSNPSRECRDDPTWNDTAHNNNRLSCGSGIEASKI